QFGETPAAPWPVTPSGGRATTAPIFVGDYPDAALVVGAADGHLYAYNLDGTLRCRTNLPLPGPVAGRLASWATTTLPAGMGTGFAIAAGSTSGDVAVWGLNQITAAPPGSGIGFTRLTGWP